MTEEKRPGRTWKCLMPYIVAVLLFFAIPAVYFAPQFSGKVLRQSDMIQYEGAAHEVELHREAYGEDPQWLGNSFSGMPANLVTMEHNTQLISQLKPLTYLFGFPTSYIFIAMAAFFVMLLMMGMNPWAAIVPAIAYGLSTYFFIIIDVGHVTKMWALAYAPLMLGAVFYTYRRNMWLGAALTALFAALEIAAGHPQITYYFTMVLVAFWINELVVAVKAKALPHFAKATGLIALAAALALGANYSTFHDQLQYSGDSIRGGSELAVEGDAARDASGLDLEYATAWSYGKMESFNMFIPDLMGGSSSGGFEDDGDVARALSRFGARDYSKYLGAYWGPQSWTAGPTYIGAVIIFLCVLGLFLLRGRCKWWVVAITLIALMLAWGRNFMWFTELFFNYLPGYNKFRTVAMILVIAEWSVPFIAALLLGKLWKEELSKGQIVKALKYSVIVCGGVALFFLLLGGTIFDFSGAGDRNLLMQIGMGGGLNQTEAGQFADSVIPAMVSERASILRADALRSLIFVLLTAATVWLFAASKLKKLWMVGMLAVLVCADLIPVNLRYLPQSRFVEERTTVIQPSPADKQILQDKTLGFRVLNLTVSPFNDATTSYFHRSVGGYHGAKMSRYQDLIDHHLSRNNMEVFNMLDTRYFIIPDERTGMPVAQLNPGANGPAWFVETIVMADNPKQEIEMLAGIETKHQAVVDRQFIELLNIPVSPLDSTAHIELTEYKANHLTYKYYSPTPTYAIFSEIYYDKGWKAYIDGVEAPHFRANYVLRGMELPAGEHTVEFRYRAAGFDMASKVTLVFSLIIIAGVVAAVVFFIMCKRKKRKQNEREQEA